MRVILRFSAITVVMMAVVSVGCDMPDSAVSPAVVAEHRGRLTLAEEPDGVQTVLDVREALLGESVAAHDEHAGHDHDEHADDEHAGHDHDEHADEEHAGHDHDEHADDEHAGHDHDEHADDEHAGHDHEDSHEHAHQHEEVVEVEQAGPIDVLMVGTIGGLANPWEETQPNFPFAKNQASFFLADPGAVAELEASGHVHAPGEECAFCAAHAADGSSMLAMVQFADENGDILPIGIPQMFDVKEQDTVVIQGKARIVAGGMMIVDATGIYVRR
jgi:hypothetical protein